MECGSLLPLSKAADCRRSPSGTSRLSINPLDSWPHPAWSNNLDERHSIHHRNTNRPVPAGISPGE